MAAIKKCESIRTDDGITAEWLTVTQHKPWYRVLEDVSTHNLCRQKVNGLLGCPNALA